MNITKNQAIALLGLLGVSGASQQGATEGGFILPDVITQIAQTVPLPVLAILLFIGYLFYSKWKETGGDREIVCVDCGCVIGIDRVKPSERTAGAND